MLLKEVMDKGAPNKKPCEVFDLIGGTSTGGFVQLRDKSLCHILCGAD